MKWVYGLSEGSRDMRELLGGKGANLAEMTRLLGVGRVPPGFTITTEACVAYLAADRRRPEGLDQQVDDALTALEAEAGKRLGDPSDPLLVSVRSGARASMPGMLDTVLNLGLNDDSVNGLAGATGGERFAWDSFRRFVQMFGNVVRGIPSERFESAIEEIKRHRAGRARHRPRRGRSARADRGLSPHLRAQHRRALPARSPSSAAGVDRSRLPLLGRRARRHLSAAERDPG